MYIAHDNGISAQNLGTEMGFEAFVIWFEGLMVLYWKGGIFTEKEKVKDYW